MEEIRRAYGVCPNCGRSILGMNNRETAYQVLYGSPVRNCKRCRKPYIDSRYHEIAITGIGERTLSVKYSLKVLGIIGMILVVSVGWNVVNIRMRGRYSVMMALLSLLSVILILYVLWDILMIATGKKAQKMERLRQESEERLRDPDYARLLADAGYLVPGQYLQDTKEPLL